MKTLYILTIFHGPKETQAFYAKREDALKAAYALLRREKPVTVECIVYDNDDNIIRKSHVY